MTENTTLHAYIGYRDAQAALDWLSRVFGFEVLMSFPDDDGGIRHAEARVGDAAITAFSDRDGFERPPRTGDTGGLGLYLAAADRADVDQAHARAVAEGATVIWAPADTEWGNYRCRVVDPEGVEWTVGTPRPGQPQGDWS